jgi:hypothetical protein
MKTLPLRTLLRDPLKVKRLTKAGTVVRITDKGKPLWDVTPVPAADEKDPERERFLDEYFDKLLKEKPSDISLSKIIIDSRR